MTLNASLGQPHIGDALLLQSQHSWQCGLRRPNSIPQLSKSSAFSLGRSRSECTQRVQQACKRRRNHKQVHCSSTEAAAQAAPQQQHAGEVIRRAGLVAACSLAVYLWCRSSSLRAGTRFCSIAVAAGASHAGSFRDTELMSRVAGKLQWN